MRFLSIGEHALEVPVQSPHDADARQHRGPAVFRDEDQGLYGCAPFRRVVLGFRQLRDVGRGVPQRDGSGGRWEAGLARRNAGTSPCQGCALASSEHAAGRPPARMQTRYIQGST